MIPLLLIPHPHWVIALAATAWVAATLALSWIAVELWLIDWHRRREERELAADPLMRRWRGQS